MRTLIVPLVVLASMSWLSAGDNGADSAEAAPTAAEAADQSASPLNADGKLVRFERDIAPILRSRCLQCHGPQKANAELRVDDPNSLGDYIEPGDAESSMLYADFLTSEDPETLMPPTSHQGPLSPGELALIRVWISEGADWPADFQLTDDSEVVLPPADSAPPLTLAERLFKAIGYLHPVVIHFPIALFLFGALFVVLSLKWPAISDQIPLFCLLIGTVAAIAAVVMGWSLATTRGYGEEWEFMSFDREVDAHRWSAVIVLIVAMTTSLVALVAIWKSSEKLHKIWKTGLLACGIAVGLVGHQGGELTYGRDFYPEMFRILTGQREADQQDQNPELNQAARQSEDGPADLTMVSG